MGILIILLILLIFGSSLLAALISGIFQLIGFLFVAAFRFWQVVLFVLFIMLLASLI